MLFGAFSDKALLVKIRFHDFSTNMACPWDSVFKQIFGNGPIL